MCAYLSPILAQGVCGWPQVVPWDLAVHVVRHVHIDVMAQELDPAHHLILSTSAADSKADVLQKADTEKQTKLHKSLQQIPRQMSCRRQTLKSRPSCTSLFAEAADRHACTQAASYSQDEGAPFGVITVHGARELRLGGVPLVGGLEGDVGRGVVHHREG